MTAYRIELFDGVVLRDTNGQVVEITSAKEQALLAYLALNGGRPLGRGQLAGLLWGDQPESQARHSLSQALSLLLSKLDNNGATIERRRHTITFRKSAFTVDLLEFEFLASSEDPADLQRALEMYSGGLLESLDVKEPDFEEWVLALRVRTRDKALQAGLDCLAKSVGKAPKDEAIGVARMLLQIDPSAEPVHQFLIRLLSTSGQHGAARRQLQTCRRILRVEFGIEPAPETERLLGAVVSAPRSLAEATRKFGQGESGIPSVVVLPFEETLDDGELERIGAGLIDDITMELTRYRSFFVISHDSANAFRTGREDVSELCARLGVRHALCGGIRRTRAGYRINIRLVEGANGQSLWSERYDLAGDDFVDVSDAVTTELVSRLAGSLESEALSRTRRVPAESWDAYSHLLQGLAYHHKSWHATRNVVMAIKHFEQAIELDPTCARAYAHLACARAWPWGRRRDNSLLDPCIVLARRAIELDPLEAEGHRMLGGIHLVRAEHDLSAECFAKAEALNPGHADIRAHAARHYMHVGNLRRATENLGKARQLNPLHPTWYWEHFAVASFIAQDYEETLISLSRMSSHSFYDRLYAAAASAYLGRDANARRHVELALISRPNLTVKNVVRVLPYKDQEKIKHVVDGLYRAGLPS